MRLCFRKTMSRNPAIPESIQEKWQTIVNLMPETLGVRAGLIMCINGPGTKFWFTLA
jgi:hypothetical protein